MTELDKALADISDIRSRLAAGTLFQGFGPAAVAATGALAIAAATAQVLWPELLGSTPETFLAVWIAVAFLSAALIGAEMAARSRRRHSGLSTAMIANALEQFLPAGAAGAVIAAGLERYAPQNLWMLPGLWQLLVALGIFAALRSLPRAVLFAAGWYFVAGAAVLVIASKDQTLSPFMMGIPFGIGQLLAAAVLHFAEGEGDD
jgi:hypothetical protein